MSLILLAVLAGCRPDGVVAWCCTGDPGADSAELSTSCTDCDGDGWSIDEGDCDDFDAAVHPEAPERCNGDDDDCDGAVDEEAEDAQAFLDADGDGYGDPLQTLYACELPEGYVREAGDCDDGDADAHPGAEEVPDGADNDCDGLTDEIDADPGLFFVHRSIQEENRLDVYYSEGDGSFSAPETIGEDYGEEYEGFVVADFDGDGSLEIFAHTESTGIQVVLDYLESEDGNRSWIGIPGPEAMPYDVFGGGDLDGDGDIDLFGKTERPDNTGWVSLGQGDGTFQHIEGAVDLAPIDTGYVIHFPYRSRDLDGDGIEDLVCSEISDGGDPPSGMYLFRGRGDGSFDAAEYLFHAEMPIGAISFLHADGDAHYDMVFGMDDDGDPGQVWLIYGTAEGFETTTTEIFDLAPGHESGIDEPGGGRIRAFDWTGDGLAELLIDWCVDATSLAQDRTDRYVHDGLGNFSYSDTVLDYDDVSGSSSVPILLDE